MLHGQIGTGGNLALYYRLNEIINLLPHSHNFFLGPLYERAFDNFVEGRGFSTFNPSHTKKNDYYKFCKVLCRDETELKVSIRKSPGSERGKRVKQANTSSMSLTFISYSPCRVLSREPYTLKKFDTCHYALKSSIHFNLISDTAWC